MLIGTAPRASAVAAQRVSLDPFAVAVDVVLLLPDRCAMFHLLDQIATGLEGLVTMTRTGRSDHAGFADLETTTAVSQPEACFEAPLIQCLRCDLGKHVLAQRSVQIVTHAQHRSPLVQIAHPSDKQICGTVARGAAEVQCRMPIQTLIG